MWVKATEGVRQPRIGLYMTRLHPSNNFLSQACSRLKLHKHAEMEEVIKVLKEQGGFQVSSSPVQPYTSSLCFIHADEVVNSGPQE